MLKEAASLEREDYAMNAVNIPVTIAPEAAARIAELGFEKQVAQMIDYARDHFSGLVRIEVGLNLRYDEPDTPDGVVIEGCCDLPYDPSDRTREDLLSWMVTTFPPQVMEHLTLNRCLGG